MAAGWSPASSVDRRQVGGTETGTPYRVKLDIYKVIRWVMEGKEKRREGRERERERGRETASQRGQTEREWG